MEKINVFNWLKDVGLKAFAVFLVVAAGFYAYAAITWPGATPNDVSGVVGMFVGPSDGAFGASLGYEGANVLCSGHSDANIAGSHVCTPDEMMNSYNHMNANSPIHPTQYTGPVTLWINNGPPGYEANANDCGGWKITDPGAGGSPNFGTVWNFNSDRGVLKRCGTGRGFACCR